MSALGGKWASHYPRFFGLWDLFFPEGPIFSEKAARFQVRVPGSDVHLLPCGGDSAIKIRLGASQAAMFFALPIREVSFGPLVAAAPRQAGR
ncbi:MAG: hypothetical protein HQL51_09900 [Magnetococcales bacterium]|nr:hypothetical protein [Magnetococcales bacterium]